MDKSYIVLIIGLFLVLLGVAMLIEFITEFAQLIVGLVILVVGIYLVGYAKQSKPKIRVR